MTRLLLPLLVASAAAPALAQHQGHAGHAPPPAEAERAADPHAGHAMSSQPQAGDQAQPDPHAGHVMPPPAPPAPSPMPPDPHAGHQMDPTATEPPAPPVGPPPPEAGSGPARAADAIHGQEQMARAHEQLRVEHGATNHYRFTIDQLEISVGSGPNGYAWEDVQFWYGGDRNKIWIKSEGEGRFGEELERAEIQALWSRAISPFFDLQTGIRYDFRPEPDRGHLVLGVQGLAPYWFEIDAAAFLSEKGDVTARFEGEYDLRITQRLILQPRTELDFSLQDVPELDIGAGLSTAEVGLRLRYEIVPEFAPYVGVQYEHAFGDTADFRRADGEDAGGWSFLLGVRAWF